MWRVGDVTITKIAEGEYLVPGSLPLPDATPERLAAMLWLTPDYVDARGRLRFSVHALLVDTPSSRVLVDTCVGNDKQDRDAPAWNRLATPFLRRLRDAGCEPESVDVVLCTHLHLDHVGWNTTLVDGNWRPTFPNARHLIARDELAHWQGQEQSRETRALLADSLQPIMDSGQVVLIDLPYQVCPELALVSTPGHTPGHASVAIESKGELAFITGDILHHPCQLSELGWRAHADGDGRLAEQTRRTELARCERGGALVLGTHFAEPSAGYLRRSGNGYGFERDRPQASDQSARAGRPDREA